MKQSVTSCLYVLAALLSAGAPALLSGQVSDPDPTRFAETIERFAAYDAMNSFPANATVFVGSSSVVRWNTADGLPGIPLINRGFGGSQMSDLVHYVEETVIKYAPRTVVVYEGDNDSAAGKRSAQILEDYKEFVEAVLTAQPSTRIVIMSIKPSLARWNVWDEMQASNAALEAYADEDARVDFIDVGTDMLGADGLPIAEYLVGDGLHMTPAGYVVWNRIVGEALMQGHMGGIHMMHQGAGH
jgi:lysophospholipase L1-like esterase